ncbi:uncharacterized protein L3040_008592 [Drepanopeziza brunnea f. sp. 'multigermtubi']|uniref:uncharacterized protein n=1 Tax=Drepanopeziza brunnea f. sp. 'multigermtubi' TaxID=698441 RepID=UPI00238EC902|nr:hypothetical protein L3040_008592 [Drepanopeziza brunnea f. sp. 'multigermtubi']
MSTNFYDTAQDPNLVSQGLFYQLWQAVPISPIILATLLLGPLIIFLTASLLLIGGVEKPEDESERDVWMLPFQPVPWRILESFFGIPKRVELRYQEALEELNSCSKYLLDEPHMTKIIKNLVQNLERNTPQMISFVDSPIDLQPWERYAEARFISLSETELNLTSLLRDMIGHTAVPAVFGHALIEKYPSILHDVRDMDAGRSYLLRKLPAWLPWPAVIQAHMARLKVWKCLDDHQKAVDAAVSEEDIEGSWGDLGDVSEFIMKRNEVYRRYGIEVKERAEISVLWSLAANSALISYWQIHHILTIPGLVDRIRAEITPYASVAKPFSIGTIFEAPKLKLDYDSLLARCPLLKSTFLETLRLVDEQWGLRKSFLGDVKPVDNITFPEKFNPDRYLDSLPEERKGSITSAGSLDSSLQKSNRFVEIECLAFVAAILVFWDITPADKSTGWTIPEKQRLGGIAAPASETRVRIKRRKFEWVE